VPLWDAIVTYEFVDPEYQRMLEAIHLARHGNTGTLRTLVAQIHQASGAPAELFSAGLHAATLCADLRFPWATTTPIARRPPLLARRVKPLPDRAFWPFTRATATGDGFVKTCLPWPVTPAVPSPPAGSRLASVPVLLVDGDHDLSTPLEWAREEARLAPRGRLVVVHGASHSVQTREPGRAGRAAVEAFLLGPETA
jgi:pimeloyl-ACP methyl ester carboxylesterase